MYKSGGKKGRKFSRTKNIGRSFTQKDERGYVRIYSWNQKTKKAVYIYEHKKIMEQYLKRSLNHGEIIHHKNHNKSDNRLENLVLLSRVNHALLHHPNQKKLCVCATCKKELWRQPWTLKKNKFSYCSLICQAKGLKDRYTGIPIRQRQHV